MPGVVGAEPFSAKLRYTGPKDPDFANLIKLTVTMPHIDGRYPGESKKDLRSIVCTYNLVWFASLTFSLRLMFKLICFSQFSLPSFESLST